MNPDSPKTPQEEMEARLIALLLGELSAQEAAAWRAAIATNPELAKLHDRLKQTISLVREATAKVTEPVSEQAAPLKLSEERREKLLAHFKTVKPKEFVPPKRRVVSWLVPMAATAVLILLLAAIAIPNFTRARSSSQANAVINNLRLLDSAKQMWALEHGKSPSDVPTFADIKDYMKGELPPSVTGETYVLGKVGEPVLAEVDASVAKRRLSRLSIEQTSQVAGEQRVRLSADSTTAARANAESVAKSAKPTLGFRTWGSEPVASSPGLFDSAVSATSKTALSEERRKVQVSGQLDHFYSDSNRTPPATPPPTSGAAIAINGVEQSTFAGRGVSPTTGQTSDDFSRDGAALGQILTVTRADPATSSYGLGLEPANRESGARAGGAGGAGGAFTAGGLPVGPQNAPGQVAAGDVVAGYAISPTPAPQPAKPQEAVPPIVALTTESDADKAPVLGEAPTVGKLFQSDSSSFANRGRQLSVDQTTLGRDQSGKKAGENLGGDKLGAIALQTPTAGGIPDASSLLEARSRSEPAETSGVRAKAGAAWTEESLRRKSSAIVLPSVESNGRMPSDKAADQLALARKDKVEATTKAQDGRVLLEAGKLADAEVKLHEAIKADPDDASAFYYLNLAKERGYAEAEGKREQDSKAGVKEVKQTYEKLFQLAQGKTESLKDQIAELEPEVRAAQKKVDALGSAEKAEELLPPGNKFVKALPMATANAAGAPLSEADNPRTESDLPIRKPATNAPIPQPEIQTSENSFSTFSLNVSDVSFKLAAASLEQGQMPDHAWIRSEEFINAFDYRDPEAPPGVPVAFAWERSRYPFAHNRDLLRFSLKTAAAGRQAGRPLNLVLLLDNSGSMERADRVSIIREALRVLAGQLQVQDKLSVITFARTPRLWVDGVSGDKAGEVAEQISSLTPQGGTNFEEGMNAAYAAALRHYLARGINRVVMLTDGAANLGNVDPESLKQKVEAHRKQGIALDCFGIGWEGFNDDLLEVLSRNGDGRYGFINSPEEAATEFAGQLAGALRVAASDVKVQVEFNPARVTAYRQIGYAKHRLTKEQFRDNSVDAAEIAAQEAGNALYTAEVNPTGEGPLCIVRVRFKIPGTSDYREHEWAVPYTGSAVSLEQASPAMRLAASASAFSEWLVASPFAAEVTPDALLGYLGGVPELYGADARPKKLEWMIRQAKSIEGK